MTSPTTIKEIEFLYKNLPGKKIMGSTDFTGKF